MSSTPSEDVCTIIEKIGTDLFRRNFRRFRRTSPLWRKYQGNQDIERLVLEVQFSRNVIDDIDVYFLSIHRAWREQNVGELVAIEKVRVLLINSIYDKAF